MFVWVYLVLRFGINYFALLTRYRAGLDRETQVSAEARHYAEQLTELRNDMDAKIQLLNGLKEQIHMFRKEFAYAHKEHREVESKLTEMLAGVDITPPDPMDRDIHTRQGGEVKHLEAYHVKIAQAISILTDRTQHIMQVSSGANEVEVLFQKPAVRNFELRKTAEAKRWSQNFGPVVKVDQLVEEVIQNDETKEPFARFQGQGCA